MTFTESLDKGKITSLILYVLYMYSLIFRRWLLMHVLNMVIQQFQLQLSPFLETIQTNLNYIYNVILDLVV